MASTTVKVHPLVLLNVVDHVTRFNLSHRSTPTSPPASRPSTFLGTAGLLIGTISPAGAATTTAVLISSFELPPKLDEVGEPIPLSGTAAAAAAVTPTAGGSGGDVDLVRLVERGVDWDAARQHRAQLGSVMPESSVVGCYVVCTGTRDGHTCQDRRTPAAAAAAAASASKKPRNETQVDADVGSTSPLSLQGIEDIAQSLAAALQQARLLPSAGAFGGGDGFVLLVVYDGEVMQRGSHHRLPFETLWVTSEQQQQLQQGNVCTAAAAASTVTPSDMEWIGLALPAPSTSCAVSAVESGATPGRPGFLRRCSAVLLSAATTGDAAALQTPTGTSPLTPSNANGNTTTALAACPPPSSSLVPHSGSAASGLLSCLRVLTRAVDVTVPTPEGGSTPASPSAGLHTHITNGGADVLRTVATCVRNVPHTHAHSLQPQQRSAVATTTTTMTTGSALEEDLVRALLAMEARCAMQLSHLQSSQHGVVARRKSAVNSAGGNRKGTPPRATAAAAAAAAANGELQRSSAGSLSNAARRGGRDGPSGGGGGDGDGRYPGQREGRTKSAPVTVVHGYVQPR